MAKNLPKRKTHFTFKKYKIEQETFDAPFMLCVGTEKDMVNYLNSISENRREWVEEDTEDYGAYYQNLKTTKKLDVRRFIWIKSFSSSIQDISILSHEVLHYVISTLCEKGMKLTNQSEEAFTYLFEYSFKECLKVLQYKR